jgi:hypothetical protein
MPRPATSERHLLALALVALAGCASPSGESSSPEPVGAVESAVSIACTDNTFDAPCDPDGFGGPLGECEGVCRLDAKGSMACVAVTSLGATPSALDGRLCGTPSANDCGLFGRFCVAGKCKDPNGPGSALPDGIPCQPTAFAHMCEGACKGGFCQGLGNSACPYGRGGVGALTNCLFATCDPKSATTCVQVPLAKATLCDDGSACTAAPDSCDAGGGCGGPPLPCDDGNLCTIDGCDAKTGCTHVLAPDGTSCADADACNGAEACVGGACKKGPPPSCDDANPCTADTCVAQAGCIHVALQDGLPCSNGDVCDGAEVCQKGLCAAGAPLSCDDGDPCTADTCDAVKGCVHAPSCGDAGAGGGALGGAGGAAATGGAGGGAATGGAGGVSATGGAGGAPASGGAGGHAIGGAGGHGTGGSGGVAATGGAGGHAMGGAGGHATAGGGGVAASGGHGGAAGAPSAGGGASTGHGGASTIDAGTAVAAGARPPLDPSDVGGCGCAVPGQGAGDDTALGALALSLLGAASRLQRRRRAR